MDSAEYVGMYKGERSADTAIDVALGGEIDDMGDGVLLEKRLDLLEVGDVGLLESVVGALLYLFEIGKIACVGEGIYIDE